MGFGENTFADSGATPTSALATAALRSSVGRPSASIHMSSIPSCEPETIALLALKHAHRSASDPETTSMYW